MSKIKVLARPCSLQRLKRSISLLSLPASGGPRHLWLVAIHSSNQCLHPHMALFFSLLFCFILFYSILFNVGHCLHLFFPLIMPHVAPWPGIKPMSPALGDVFLIIEGSPQASALYLGLWIITSFLSLDWTMSLVKTRTGSFIYASSSAYDLCL